MDNFAFSIRVHNLKVHYYRHNKLKTALLLAICKDKRVASEDIKRILHGMKKHAKIEGVLY